MNEFIKMYQERDNAYWKYINDIAGDKLTLEFMFKNYMSFIQRRDLGQLLAYYELFKQIKNLPGSIAEVGVFAGNGLFTWSKLMDTLVPTNSQRKIYGFDNYKAYTKQLTTKDEKAVEYIHNKVGNFDFDYNIVEKLIYFNNLDQVIAGTERVKLYNADLGDGLKLFKSENIGVRFSLVLIDVNLYEPTKFALENFFELLIPGGILALRGYAVKPWEGESSAVDDFLQAKCISNLQSFEFSNYPSVFFKKLY
jgi:hypothetical protein